LECVFVYSQALVIVLSKTMTNPQPGQAARHVKLWAAGGLQPTEMNE